jgi:hypothetical protein
MAKKGVERQEKTEESKTELTPEKEEKTELTPEEEKAIMSEPIEGYDKKAQDNPDFFAEEITEEVKEETTEEKTEEKTEVPPEEEKAEEKTEEKEETVTPAEPEPKKEDFFDKMEKELAKPEGKEDIKEFSEREKAYFWQMRRDRRARQKAEEERDVLRFEQLKAKQAPKKEQVEEEPDVLKGREDEDFITVKDLKTITEKINKKQPPQIGEQPIPPDPIRMAYLKQCEELAKKEYSDYKDVELCADEIVANSTPYQMKIIDALVKGENPAVVMYNIIKGDPDFESVLEKKLGKKKEPLKEEEKTDEPDPEQVKKVEVAKKAQEKM